MAFPGLCRWTAHKCSRICCRSSFPLNGLLLSQQRSFSLEGSNGIKFLGSSSSRGRTGCRHVLKRKSSEKLLIARVYSSATGDVKDASSSSAEDNYDQSNLNTPEACTLYLSEEDLETLTNGNPEMIKKVRHIQMEHEVFMQEGELVPSMPIPLERWEDLLSKANIHQRKQYYYFLYDLEIVKERKKLSKKLFREQQEECRNSLPTKSAWEMDEHRMVYGICGNTLFLQLRHTTEHSFYENRLIQAMKFGPAIVIDCGYDHCMDTRESRSCSTQIEMAYALNRIHPRPFDLHLCNLQQGTNLEKYMDRRIPSLYNPANVLNVTNKSYLDVFPKERLVYLTPYAREDLDEFDEDKVYIIGGVVKLHGSDRYCMAKAKKEGIPTKKLPLDQYLKWGGGKKNLPFNIIVKILLDANYHKNWNIAFKHIPLRKLAKRLDDDVTTHNNPAPQKHIYPPTFITRTSPKPSYSDDDERDPRKSHNVNRVNVIEAPLRTDRNRYQRPERSLYNPNSISNNFSNHDYLDFEENNVRRESSYQRKFKNFGYTERDESQESSRREFNVHGFLKPKG